MNILKTYLLKRRIKSLFYHKDKIKDINTSNKILNFVKTTRIPEEVSSYGCQLASYCDFFIQIHRCGTDHVDENIIKDVLDAFHQLTLDEHVIFKQNEFGIFLCLSKRAAYRVYKLVTSLVLYNREYTSKDVYFMAFLYFYDIINEEKGLDNVFTGDKVTSILGKIDTRSFYVAMSTKNLFDGRLTHSIDKRKHDIFIESMTQWVSFKDSPQIQYVVEYLLNNNREDSDTSQDGCFILAMKMCTDVHNKDIFNLSQWKIKHPDISYRDTEMKILKAIDYNIPISLLC